MKSIKSVMVGLCMSISAFGFAVMAYPIAFMVSASADAVFLVKLNDAEERDWILEDLPEPSHPDYEKELIDAYGMRHTPDPIEILFAPQDKIVRPQEAPHLVLLDFNPENDPPLIQAQTVFFFSKWVLWGASLAGAALMMFATILAGRRQTA